MVSYILSCACWPFTYLLGRNDYSSPLPIFKLVCLFIAKIILDIDAYQIHNLQIISFICLSFHFLDNVLRFTKVLNFGEA